jgi:hypothetical protein
VGTVRYQANLINSITGTLNPAITDVCFNDASGLTPGDLTARVAAWVAACQWAYGSAVTVIDSIVSQNMPSGAVTPRAWDATAYNALVTNFNTEFAATILPALTGYGQAIGGPATGTSSGRGDSVCVNTRASAAGRHGRGRNFIPFLKREVIGTDGLILPASTVTVAAFFRYLFMSGGSAPITNADPVVFSRTLGTASPIDFVTVNVIPSRLRSRTK